MSMMFKIRSFFLIGLAWNIMQRFTIVRGASCEKYISESSDYRLSHGGETGSAHWGMKTKGGYYRTIKKVTSLSDCFESCVKRTKCNSFTYTPRKDTCSLSKKYGVTSSKQVGKQSVQFCESRDSIAGFILRNAQSSISLVTQTSNGTVAPAPQPAPQPAPAPAPAPAPQPAPAPVPSPETVSPPDSTSPSPSSPDSTSPSPSSPDNTSSPVLSPSPSIVTPSPSPSFGNDVDDDDVDDVDHVDHVDHVDDVDDDDDDDSEDKDHGESEDEEEDDD